MPRRHTVPPAQRLAAAHSFEADAAALLGDVRRLIEASRQRAVTVVNAELSTLYWHIGHRVHTEVLAGQRARYGEEIIQTLASQLVLDYGRSFAEKNLRRMVQFAMSYPDEAIVVTLSRQLSWSHFVALLPLKDPLQRDFYAQMASSERWSVRTLRERIDSMLYERTALSQAPGETIARELAAMRDAQRVSPALIMRDPYILDFLSLQDTWQERDLEAAIIREMESFLLELGAGFSFVARQKRIQIDDEDFHLDLLFYNRKLRRLVAVELKVGEFKPAYKGQMELYLRWLDKHEREEAEASPLGIILCAGKKAEQIELLELDRSGIHVAEYLTTLPPREVLAERLQQATRRAASRFARRSVERGALAGSESEC
ncbi:PDDEXK nuclease domain-containing protein [Cupriavidus plantarum]|uniref:PDDEXK nuclease domain-containing protein n=1 Tax=Cupriavidus plantarum TaxID=942865 RepID=UPI0015C75DC9|nr:PDDEXK nuclease domain-containing protein [Cupriavidus plantarum]NYI00725.1 putative nuclease of restriction endonuclease-like (RecB) superfamily [Cupriavidus plantarum]